MNPGPNGECPVCERDVEGDSLGGEATLHGETIGGMCADCTNSIGMF